MFNIPAYLDRIGYSGSREPSADTLRALHCAHMRAVPFENLDIHLGRPIVRDEDSFLRKIIGECRGGFCYELNGAFAALLRALGFRVTLLSARVAGAHGSYGLEFDHLTLCVETCVPTCGDLPAVSGATWLADVGFGDSFVEPLLLQSDLEQSQIGRVYRLVEMKRQNGVEIESVFYLEVRPEMKPFPERLSSEKSAPENWKRQYSPAGDVPNRFADRVDQSGVVKSKVASTLTARS